MLYEVLLVVDLLVAIMLIGLILIQQGKGADMGAAFGAGASNTVFGSTGSGNFLTKSTAVLATIFFAVSLALGNMSSGTQVEDDGLGLDVPVAVSQPVEVPANTDVPAATDAGVPAADVPAAEQQQEGDVPAADDNN